MNRGLDSVRNSFGRFLVGLFWLHVPIQAGVAWFVGKPLAGVTIAATLIAALYHISWARNRSAPSTRNLSAVALMGQPAMLVYLLSGNPWQMDMHMYFFAMLALTIAWCDRRVILVAATAVAVHHLVLDMFLPLTVFPGGSDISRVIFHAAVVAFQTAVLVWLSNMLEDSFGRIGAMRDEILAKNVALEERTQEAEAANRAKSMFLANMSHEIRTPMNAVLGFCHLALRTNLPPRAHDYVSKINGAATSLLRLINDILDFSKNEAGKLVLDPAPFNLRATVEEQIQLAEITAKAKGVQLQAVVDADVPEALLGDSLRFSQVLLNLVSNAVKFTDKGSVTLTIQVAEKSDDDIVLSVAVKDTGLGMNEAQRASLFTLFSQADSSTTRRFGGTGLGLAISKQIVEHMGGTIVVESAPNLGSTFTFTVAMKQTQLGEVVTFTNAHAELAGLRVLIADDNPASREILHAIFANWSVAADQVASGPEVLGALEAAEARGTPYDLLLIDWKMPGMDGIETVGAIQESANIAHPPAIFLVTAYGSEEIRANAVGADIAAVLVKPVDPQALLETVTLHRTGNAPDKAPRRSADETGAAISGSLPMVRSELQGQRVLLVEDNEINQEIATELLRDAGLEVDVAENGAIACERVKFVGPIYAGILMDVQMPVMDGFEATRHIRKIWSPDEMPIIAMTAHAYETERQRCFENGMNDHIAKPVDPLILVRTLNKWLKARVVEKDVEDSVTAEAAPTSDLPAFLPPFDIAAALVRVNGKEALLRRLIQVFATTYWNAEATLREHALRGRKSEGHVLAHTLKGVAASLELSSVAEAAKKVESAFAEGALAEADPLITELGKALTPAIAAANSLKENVAKAPTDTAANRDPIAMASARDALETALKRRSLRARATFAEYARIYGLSAQEIEDNPIHHAIERLDYDAALAGLLAAANAEVDGVQA